MPVTSETLQEAIKTRLHASHVHIEDVSGGCGNAYEVVIVSDQFQGKNKLARNRLVFGALKEEIAEIHAFTQKDYTPEEWEKLSQQS